MTPSEAHNLFDYCPYTGILRWKEGPRKGREAGFKASRGYRRVEVNGRRYYIHRIAWALTYGRWPRLIDHRNRIHDDNRIGNLREATPSQNRRNSRVRSDSKSGVKGVRTTKTGRFIPSWSCGGKRHNWKRSYINPYAAGAVAAVLHRIAAGGTI